MSGQPLILVSWVDFLQWGGRQYVASVERLGAGVAGPVVKDRLGETGCELSVDRFDEHRLPHDGESALLPPGSEVYSVQGYEPSVWLAVRSGHTLRLFKVDTDPVGRTEAARPPWAAPGRTG